MRSKDERLRWNETNAPRTIPTVRMASSALTRTDLRIERQRAIQWWCREKNGRNPLIRHVESCFGFPEPINFRPTAWIWSPDFWSVESVGSPKMTRVFEAIHSRETQLGELKIRRALPVRERRMIGPWCFLDRYGPLSF